MFKDETRSDNVQQNKKLNSSLSSPKTRQDSKWSEWLFNSKKKGPSPPAGSTCVCPRCGEKAAHQAGLPCVDTICPACGAPMARKF